MEKKLRKEVEFLDYIGSRKEPYKYPSSPADSTYIADQGMTGTLAEATKPVVEEISKVLEYVTEFFKWDTDPTTDTILSDTLTQYRKRPDYLKNEKQFNALLSGWSLNTNTIEGLKPVDLKSFNSQELKDLAIDIDSFIKSADIPMIISDTLEEDMTTAAIAVPEGGMTTSPIKKKQNLGYTSLNENDYPEEAIKSFYDRPDAEQILADFKKIAQEYKLNVGKDELISTQIAKRNPVFQKEIISKFDELAKNYNLTLQSLGLQEESNKKLHILGVELGKDSGFAQGAIGRNLIITLSDGSKVESNDDDLLGRYKQLRTGDRKNIEKLNNILYRVPWNTLNETYYNKEWNLQSIVSWVKDYANEHNLDLKEIHKEVRNSKISRSKTNITIYDIGDKDGIVILDDHVEGAPRLNSIKVILGEKGSSVGSLKNAIRLDDTTKSDLLKTFDNFFNKLKKEDYDYNRAEIEMQDKQDFNQSESDRVFLAQLLSSYKIKFPPNLQVKLENLFYTNNITNVNEVNLDIFSDSFIKNMRGKVEELIQKSGLKLDAFESKEVKAKKIVESYGLIEKEEEEEKEEEVKETEEVYSFKSKNRVIIVKGFEETQARDIAVKVMAPSDKLPELPEGQYELSYILPGAEELTEDSKTNTANRYIVSFDAYMYAKDDDAIKKAAAAFARKLDLEYDNKASVLEIYEAPFGSTSSRKIS